MLQIDPQSQRLYLHDAVTEKESAESSDGHLSTTGPNATEGELYTTNILLNALNVKAEDQDKFSLRSSNLSNMDVLLEAAEAVKNGDER